MLYTFYGDDFTGSTDVLEQLANGGVRAALFLKPPTPDDLSRLPNLQALGVAGDSRSQTPEWMTSHLPRIFEQLRSFNAPITQYKVCSTFDSSPQRGNIGRALELGLETFRSPFVPVVVGAPHLKRFVRDGELFAADSLGEVKRIDQHPMNRHPVTPMREPNLRRHLSAQTSMPIGEITLSGLRTPHLSNNIEQKLAEGSKSVIFDTADESDLNIIGALLVKRAAQHPLFAVGSSGLTAALTSSWQAEELVHAPAANAAPKQEATPASPILIISGSCSTVTARQIEWALNHGFHGISIDPTALLHEATGSEFCRKVVDQATKLLAEGSSVILYTAIGRPTSESQGAPLGIALGDVLRQALKSPKRRVMLCGGDTSSHSVQQLDLKALTWKRNLQTGAPICRAHSSNAYDGLELILKGGQVGTDDFFAVARDART